MLQSDLDPAPIFSNLLVSFRRDNILHNSLAIVRSDLLHNKETGSLKYSRKNFEKISAIFPSDRSYNFPTTKYASYLHIWEFHWSNYHIWCRVAHGILLASSQVDT